MSIIIKNAHNASIDYTLENEYIISMELPYSSMEAIQRLIAKCREKHEGYFQLRLDTPFRPRSTGWKSQSHRINGFIQQICQATGNYFDDVKMHCKKLAISQGYPFVTGLDGQPYPKGEPDISVEEATILIRVIEQLAAELGVILREE